MAPQELLLKAADHIETYGLQRGGWVPDEVTREWPARTEPLRECPACVGGALAIEVTRGQDFSPNFVRRPSEKKTMEEAMSLLARHLGPPPDPYMLRYPLDWIIEWSDGTDQETVVATLRAAAGSTEPVTAS